MRTVDPSRHAAKRRQILDAAARCFAAKGFDATSIADICTAAGISSGSLFHYFPSKRAVFAAIFEQDGDDIATLVSEHADSNDPWAALLRMVEAQAAPAAKPEAAGLVVELIVQASRNPELAALAERNDRALRDALSDLLDRATRSGAIDPPVRSAVAAAWISALVDATFLHADTDELGNPAERLDTLRLLVARFLGAN